MHLLNDLKIGKLEIPTAKSVPSEIFRASMPFLAFKVFNFRTRGEMVAQEEIKCFKRSPAHSTLFSSPLPHAACPESHCELSPPPASAWTLRWLSSSVCFCVLSHSWLKRGLLPISLVWGLGAPHVALNKELCMPLSSSKDHL